MCRLRSMQERTLAHYTIVAKLGEGGMGEVYRAQDQKLGRDVALKILPPHLVDDAERRKRFEREARAIAQLKHPNIITVHSIEEAEGVHFISMEYVDGPTLAAEIVEGGVPLERFFDDAIALADALSSAHGKGIVHRDLKPANIMRDDDGRLKILDFGLAKLFETDVEGAETVAANADDMTGEGRIVGTVAYMAPEQAEGGTIDARTDVFSFGIVLYEMATGRRPFQGKTNISTLSAILKEEPPSVSELRPVVPRHLGRIIARCLAKDPERRYQSALDVRNELEALRDEVRSGVHDQAHAGERTPSSDSLSAAPSGWRASARGQRLGWVLLAFAVVVVAAAGFFVLRSSRDGADAGAAAAIRSLAVLPFSSLSQDASDDYFTEGMTDVLTTELARLAELKVIARNSAARFKDSPLAPADIARELGVRALISGSVMRDQDRVRISAQLAEAQSDRVIWAESYDRPARDVLSLQSEVARAIADAIALQLSPEEKSRLDDDRSVDPRALDEYLRGRFLWSRRTEPAVRQSLAHFRTAVELAPDFALGHTGVADAYLILGAYNWMPPREASARAFEHAAKALSLDPDAGEPHASLGDLAFHVDGDLARAQRELDRALELSPGYATAYMWRSEVSMARGRTEEAMRYLEKAIELDPVHPFPRYFLAFGKEVLGDVQAAERGYRDVLQISPGYSLPARSLVLLLLGQGRTSEAVAEARRAVDVDSSPANLATLGVALARSDRADEARAILKRLEEVRAEGWVSPVDVARVESALGNRDAALRLLRTGAEAGDFRIPSLRYGVGHLFPELEGDPEVERLIETLD